MPPSTPNSVVRLTFETDALLVGDVDVRTGLSAVVLHDNTLWVACDEGCRLDRLTRSAGPLQFGGHAVFPLSEFLPLPAGPDKEADIEGLDVDDGWLWLVGSHSVKRKKPKKNDTAGDIASRLARTERDGNRHLLARIPLDGRTPRLEVGERRAASIDTSTDSSALLAAIVESGDRHLAPFVGIPGKDNGLDIEGLAVRGTRAFVGLRGPVLREWCCILELDLDQDGTALRLLPVDGVVPYRKHFVKLNGLGIRDLAWLGNDLLVLAGAAMAHDAPVEIWRWKDAAKAGTPASQADIERLMVVPHGEGTDRAEGLTVFDHGAGSTSVLVVFDSPSEARLLAPNAVNADLYRLP